MSSNNQKRSRFDLIGLLLMAGIGVFLVRAAQFCLAI